MPRPNTSLATLRPELAGSLEEFNLAMDRLGFIGLRVLPVMEVAKQSGTYGRIPIEQLLQNKETTRASSGGYSRGDFKFTTDSYATQEQGWEEPIDEREAELYAEYLDAEMVATERARDFVLRNHERRVAALIFNTSTWTGASLTTAVGTKWTNYDEATPVSDVEAAVRKEWEGTGLWPNALIISRMTFRNLRMCAEVIDRIQSAGAGSAAKASDITPAMLAAVFDLDEIIIGGAAQNTANEASAASLSGIWANDKAMVARIIRSNDLKEPGLGRTFHWGADGSAIGGTVESYRDETIRGDVIRVRHETNEKVLYKECGHLLTNCA